MKPIHWAKSLAVLTVFLCLAIMLSACGDASSGKDSSAPASDTVQNTTSDAAEWTVDESTLTDEYLLSLVIDMEIGLVGENSFTFQSADELSTDELYLCFLLLTDYSELETHLNADNQQFYFTSEVITEQLEKYFKHFQLDITENSNYDEESDAIVTPLASGFGGDRCMKVTDKTIDGNTVTFTADFYENYEMQDKSYQSKTYSIEFYDGGYYYLSAIVQ